MTTCCDKCHIVLGQCVSPACPCHTPTHQNEAEWENLIWMWATQEFPRQHADKFEKLLEVIRQNFISKAQIAEVVDAAIDEYFAGLIFIPDPQATKQSLKEAVREKLITNNKQA